MGDDEIGSDLGGCGEQGRPIGENGGREFQHVVVDAGGGVEIHDRVFAKTCGEDKGVALRAAEEHVIARAADEPVEPGTAIDRVIPGEAIQRVILGIAAEIIDTGITGDDVGACIARAVDGSCAGEGKVFEVGGKSKSGGRLNAIRARIRRLRDHVSCEINDIGIVAEPAIELIRPCAAIEIIIPRTGGCLGRLQGGSGGGCKNPRAALRRSRRNDRRCSIAVFRRVRFYDRHVPAG